MRVVAFLESENNIEGFAENGGVEGCVLITIISSQSLAAEKKKQKNDELLTAADSISVKEGGFPRGPFREILPNLLKQYFAITSTLDSDWFVA